MPAGRLGSECLISFWCHDPDGVGAKTSAIRFSRTSASIEGEGGPLIHGITLLARFVPFLEVFLNQIALQASSGVSLSLKPRANPVGVIVSGHSERRRDSIFFQSGDDDPRFVRVFLWPMAEGRPQVAFTVVQPGLRHGGPWKPGFFGDQFAEQRERRFRGWQPALAPVRKPRFRPVSMNCL